MRGPCASWPHEKWGSGLSLTGAAFAFACLMTFVSARHPDWIRRKFRIGALRLRLYHRRDATTRLAYALVDASGAPLGSILSSPYARSWERIVTAFCRGCEKWEACRGGCRAASEQMGRGLEREAPIREGREGLFRFRSGLRGGFLRDCRSLKEIG
jgi:radical SAM protein with 4Fe4S-binding SPASM domain